MKTASQNDLQVLSFLRQNSRYSLTFISKKTRLPISTLHEKLKNFKKTLINTFSAGIDFSKLGFSIRVFLLLKSKPEQKNEMIKFLCGSLNANCVYIVHNGFDIIAELYFKSLKEFEQFRTSMQERFSLVREEIAYVLEQPLIENFFSDPEMIECIK